MPQPNSFDFETIGIENRPHYPPSPVGVSIKYWGKKPKYYGWGHVTGGNNSTWGEAKAALTELWNHRAPMMCQNAKFDFAVAEKHFGLEFPGWERIHDTLFLLFLDDPRQRSFSLKPATERLLGVAPDEQDKAVDWLLEHQPVPNVKISKGKNSKHPAGKYLAYVPANILGPYCDGDSIRTELLFKHLWKSIKDRGMLEAYDRERQTLEVLYAMEKPGVQTDYERLQLDCEMYSEVREEVRLWCCKRLKQPTDPEEFKIGSGSQLLKALKVVGKVDESKLLLTPTGLQSTSKDSLEAAMEDTVLQQMMAYYSELNTCLNTFMLNYQHTASLNSEHRIFTDWNQVKQDAKSGRGVVGTSTGRLSSTPNFQNISNKFDAHFKHLVDESSFDNSREYKKVLAKTAKCPLNLPPLPLVRSYITAFDGEILIDRDYSQQELRILGHYEDGPLTEAYLANPWLDVHDWAKDMINGILHTNHSRRPIKDVGFGVVYGLGIGGLAQKMATDVDTAKLLKKTYMKVAPGIEDLYKEMRKTAKEEMPIYTWGGREYYCEEPKLIQGRLRKFDYKLVNLLIQGSAADCTKQAFINYHRNKPSHHRLILQVHDQLTASIPPNEIREGMEILRDSMEDVKFDIPMLSEGDWSNTNWDKSSLITFDKKGEVLYDGSATKPSKRRKRA